MERYGMCTLRHVHHYSCVANIKHYGDKADHNVISIHPGTQLHARRQVIGRLDYDLDAATLTLRGSCARFIRQPYSAKPIPSATISPAGLDPPQSPLERMRSRPPNPAPQFAPRLLFEAAFVQAMPHHLVSSLIAMSSARTCVELRVQISKRLLMEFTSFKRNSQAHTESPRR